MSIVVSLMWKPSAITDSIKFMLYQLSVTGATPGPSPTDDERGGVVMLRAESGSRIDSASVRF